MHLHETAPDDLVCLLSLDDADELLTGAAIRTPAIRVARDGSVLGELAYIRQGASIAGRPLSGLVDPRKALTLFAEGATIVFQGLHRYHPPLTDLVARLELELGHPCQANAYLTPPGSQGFAVHSDSHDVFVFQTHGTKLWEVHHPRGERACGHGDHDADCRVDDVLLRPGLSMYLPTGTPHAARAQDDASLHVTIGISQLTWRGLVRRTVDRLLDEVDEQHLPAGWLGHGDELRTRARRSPPGPRARPGRRRPGRRRRPRGRALPDLAQQQAAGRSPRRPRARPGSAPTRRCVAAPDDRAW